MSRKQFSHPGMAHSQDCRTKIEEESRTDPVCRDRAERAEPRKMDFHAREVEQIDNPRRASLEQSIVPGQTEEKEGGGGEPEQDLSVQIPIPSADDTLTTPEILVFAIRCDSAKFDFNSDPSRGLIKQWSKAYVTVGVPRCRILLVSRQAAV